MKEKLIAKMIEYEAGNRHDVAHLLKVYAYAETIGRLEGLDARTQETLELAAIVHDIACPLCREKYGEASGKLQEQESEAILRPFLAEFALQPEMLERIVFLVTHHHTCKGVDGLDWQILLEADYLVNADEGGQSPEAIAAFRQNVFRTESGKRLLSYVYPGA